jgi:hypothetical protein
VFEEWAANLDAPLRVEPKVIAQLVTSVFQGVAVEFLACVSENEAPHSELLETLGALIERAESW